MPLEMVSSWKWFPASSVSSPDSELGSGGGEGLPAELQVTAGLCSHSHECAGGANFLSESLWGRAARGPAVSILGWAEPWLTRSQAGESPAFPGGPCGAVPSVFWDSVGSAQPHFQRSPQTLTWPLTLSQLKGPCGLLSHWLTLPPCPGALRKCSVAQHLSDVLLLSCSHTHPSWKSRAVLQSDSGCWQKSPEVADKSPDRVYQHNQSLNSASNFSLQALRHRGRRNHLDAAQ